MQYLHLMADALMKYETIDDAQIAEIMQGKEPTPPAGWDDEPRDNGGDSSDTNANMGRGSSFLGEQTNV